jgi:small-conductance mechanosensitive channel
LRAGGAFGIPKGMSSLGRFEGWAAPAAILLAGVLAGRIADRTLLRRFRALAARTSWRGDDVVLDALRGMGTLWLTLAAAALALPLAPIAGSTVSVSRRILEVALILSLTVAAARVAAGLVRLYSAGAQAALPSTSILQNVTRIVVFAIGVLILLQTFGISITPILGALGVGGLAVALALQDTLSNLFSGLQIILSRQLSVGDYVRMESGEEGYVADINLRNTTIRQLPNNMVIVPNSKLASAIVTNYDQPEPELAVLVPVGVSYASDLEKVEKIAVEVGRETMREVPGAVADFEPFIRYNAFADSSINFSVILRGTEFVSQYLIKHEFIKRLHRRFDREGIEIPFPIRTVYLRSDAPDPQSGS